MCVRLHIHTERERERERYSQAELSEATVVYMANVVYEAPLMNRYGRRLRDRQAGRQC